MSELPAWFLLFGKFLEEDGKTNTGQPSEHKQKHNGHCDIWKKSRNLSTERLGIQTETPDQIRVYRIFSNKFQTNVFPNLHWWATTFKPLTHQHPFYNSAALWVCPGIHTKVNRQNLLPNTPKNNKFHESGVKRTGNVVLKALRWLCWALWVMLKSTPSDHNSQAVAERPLVDIYGHLL